ncbi:acyl carrier protein, partial [Bacillus thuringiensis]|uniref:acyl carrier protein n=2 Tax=Bacillus TaxID=1386 RepID=UPI002FFF85B6
IKGYNIMKQNILAVMERLLTKQDFQNLCENYDVLKEEKVFKLGIDSIRVMKLVLEVTKEFNITIDFTTLDLKNFETIQKIEAYIEGSNNK